MIISPNLTLGQLIKSPTAERLNIKNNPNEEQLSNLTVMAYEIFEPLRDLIDFPIIILSGYRCKKLNKILGGSKKSQHMEGKAIDLYSSCEKSMVENRVLFYTIKKKLKFDELIWEFGDESNPSWVHVSFDLYKNRNHVLKTFKKRKKTIYEKIN